MGSTRFSIADMMTRVYDRFGDGHHNRLRFVSDNRLWTLPREVQIVDSHPQVIYFALCTLFSCLSWNSAAQQHCREC